MLTPAEALTEMFERILPYKATVSVYCEENTDEIDRIEIYRRITTPGGGWDWLFSRVIANRPSDAPVYHAACEAARAYSERRGDDARIWEDALIRLLAR